MSSRMVKKFNEQLVKENVPQIINHLDYAVYFMVWELGRKFERERLKSFSPKNAQEKTK
ncbi:MAG: hypothetical protein NWF06_01880 [Candidatus Bathyarchaeota archaeon]|nr:hypothetical protein [Candidatus Bathyarchaeum sp.]